MAVKKQTTQEAILAAGKAEFLKLGFERASLRTIARRAGVTTGAIFGYYSDKAALFDALVAAPAEKLYSEFCGAAHEFESLSLHEQVALAGGMSQYEIDTWIDLIYDNFDAFKLIFACSGGTKWAEYVDSLIEVEEKTTRNLIAGLQRSGHTTREVSDEAIHVLTGSFFLAIIEMVIHDMERIEAKDHLALVSEFFSAGWMRLLNLESQ